MFTTGGDPVREGFVPSLNRPGGNLTGVSWFSNQTSAKALGLLHELIPNAAVIALLVNPRLQESARAVSDAQEAAHTLGLQLFVLNVSTRNEINDAFATLGQRGAGALLVCPIRSSAAGASRSSRWRRATPSPTYTRTTNLPTRAG